MPAGSFELGISTHAPNALCASEVTAFDNHPDWTKPAANKSCA